MTWRDGPCIWWPRIERVIETLERQEELFKATAAGEQHRQEIESLKRQSDLEASGKKLSPAEERIWGKSQHALVAEQASTMAQRSWDARTGSLAKQSEMFLKNWWLLNKSNTDKEDTTIGLLFADFLLGLSFCLPGLEAVLQKGGRLHSAAWSRAALCIAFWCRQVRVVHGLAGRKRKAPKSPPHVNHMWDRDAEGRGGAGVGASLRESVDVSQRLTHPCHPISLSLAHPLHGEEVCQDWTEISEEHIEEHFGGNSQGEGQWLCGDCRRLPPSQQLAPTQVHQHHAMDHGQRDGRKGRSGQPATGEEYLGEVPSLPCPRISLPRSLQRSSTPETTWLCSLEF
eukprot:s3625_g4.t1